MKIDEKHLALVKHEVIGAAHAKRDAARQKLTGAVQHVAEAQAAHKVAAEASELAVNGEGTLSPVDAEVLLEAAVRALTVSEKVRAAADAAHQAADDAITTAMGEAHKPVYAAGIELRLASARKADAARAMLAEAEVEFNQATALLNYARGQYCPPSSFVEGHVLDTHAREIARWSEPGTWWIATQKSEG